MRIFFLILMMLFFSINTYSQRLSLGIIASENLQYSNYFEPSYGLVRYPMVPILSYGISTSLVLKNGNSFNLSGTYNKYTLVALINNPFLFPAKQGFDRKIETTRGIQTVFDYCHPLLRKPYFNIQALMGIGMNFIAFNKGSGYFVDSLEYKSIQSSDYWVDYKYFLTRYVNQKANVFLEIGAKFNHQISDNIGLSGSITQQLGFNTLFANHILYDVYQYSLQNGATRVYGVSQSMGNATVFKLGLHYHFKDFKRKKS